MKWWLVSDEDVQKIRAALEAAEDLQEEQCGNYGCLCDLRGKTCWQFYTDAIHALDSGLHETDAIPADWQVPA